MNAQKPLEPIDVILFDVDETLVDFMSMKKNCVNAGLEKMIMRGLPVADVAEGHRVVDEVYRNFGMEDKMLFWHVAQYAGVTVEVTKERLAQIGKTAYRKHQRDFLAPYDGVIDTLQELTKRGITMGVLSDAPRDKIFDRLCDADLDQYFEDNVVGGNDNRKLLKPSENAFKRALRMMGCKNGKGVLMVGNDPVRDVGGAKDAGLQAAWAKYGFEPRRNEDVSKMKTRADYVLDKFSDLLQYVKK